MDTSRSSDVDRPDPSVASVPNVSTADAPAKKMPRITSLAELNQALEAVTEGERDNLKIIGKVKHRMEK